MCPLTDAGRDSRSCDQLAGLPPTPVRTVETDVVCDEGDAYVARLRAADVPITAVRHLGAVHDFVTLDAPRCPQAAAPALTRGCDTLPGALHDTFRRHAP
ncbi:alpha/beta hydrolase fold domain-containing protein [Streptomyces griseorubiginosus]|uniref:alpha/beta hydrolase fold domain-containing protein n=1 Tax=Streptomyces griseorubiginosus TaxID=67304 RepID=UPI0036E23E9A